MTNREFAGILVSTLAGLTRRELVSQWDELARGPHPTLAGRLFARGIVRELVARNLGEREEPEEDVTAGDEAWRG